MSDWAPWGERLRLLRLKQHMHQSKLAAECEMSVSMVSSVERGVRDPSMGTFLAACKALGVTPEQFFKEES